MSYLIDDHAVSGERPTHRVKALRAQLAAPSHRSSPHLAGDPLPDAELPLPRELADRFRALCAARGADPARTLAALVRSYVLLGLAEA